MEPRRHTARLLTVVYLQSFVLVFFGLWELTREDVHPLLQSDLFVPPDSPTVRDTTRSTVNGRHNSREDGVDCSPFYNDTATGTSNRAPAFVIAGAQKSGTTALFHLLKAHPKIESSLRFETHFFDRQTLPTNDAFLASDATICELRKEYRKEFRPDLPFRDTLKFEKVPSYLCKPSVPSFLHRVAPWTKVIFILRNPVDRAHSAWKMEFNTPRGGNQTTQQKSKPRVSGFRYHVAEEVKRLNRFHWVDMPPLSSFLAAPSVARVQNHTMPMTLAERHQAVSSSQHRENTTTTGVPPATQQSKLHRKLQCGHIGRGMYAQQLMGWLRYYTLNENLLVLRYEDFVANRTAVLEQLHQFVGLADPRVTVGEETLETTYKPRASLDRRKGTMGDVMRDYLTELYRPFNAELADVLGEEWRGVWDYR